jgi:uncharacterized protein YdhG (YjbR/CyaY superfamily)
MDTLIKKYKNIDEYHSMQSDSIRQLLDTIRHTIKQAAPNAEETISYGMPAFKENKVLIYYAVYKNHIGIYPGAGAIVNFEKELEKYTTSKGAIQIPLSKPIPVTLIKKLVKFRVAEDSKPKNALLHGIYHELTDDIKKAIKGNKPLIDKWNNLTPIQRNEWICWITIVKKAETRKEHIERMIAELEEGKRQPCCWPGCPHRRASAQKWFDGTAKKKNK